MFNKIQEGHSARTRFAPIETQKKKVRTCTDTRAVDFLLTTIVCMNGVCRLVVQCVDEMVPLVSPESSFTFEWASAFSSVRRVANGSVRVWRFRSATNFSRFHVRSQRRTRTRHVGWQQQDTTLFPLVPTMSRVSATTQREPMSLVSRMVRWWKTHYCCRKC